jgi:hypothetical protein
MDRMDWMDGRMEIWDFFSFWVHSEHVFSARSSCSPRKKFVYFLFFLCLFLTVFGARVLHEELVFSEEFCIWTYVYFGISICVFF